MANNSQNSGYTANLGTLARVQAAMIDGKAPGLVNADIRAIWRR